MPGAAIAQGRSPASSPMGRSACCPKRATAT
uniref:Uncharacterized protein n=1 Tax=Arundo donax TaxID=35708 RepID=A0A0A9HE07_ARUDO